MTVLTGIELIFLLDIVVIALPGIGLIVLLDFELVSRLDALLVLVGKQKASRIEGLDSHELSHLFGHFDSGSFVPLADLYQGPH